MFGLSKLLGFFLLPSNLLILLALVGILLMGTRFRRLGQVLTIVAILLLTIIGIAPIGNALMMPLEERFPKWDSRNGSPHGIVVLGGAVSPDVSAARDELALNEAAERMTAIAKLAREHPNATIVFTGGNGRLLGGASEADFVLRLFDSFGIPRHRVVLEDKARNTIENATLTKALVNPKPHQRWLLVTSAHHMPRSIGIFRQAGFPVEAHPVDFRTRGPDDLTETFGSVSAGLARTDTAVREWAGLLVYWLSGDSSDLFPAPHAAEGCNNGEDCPR